MNLAEKYEKDIPKRLQNDAIFVEKVALTRQCSVVYVITTDKRLFEVRERGILGEVPLVLNTAHTGHHDPIATNRGLFNDTQYDMDTSTVVESEHPINVSIKLFRANDGTKRKLFVLVQLDRSLIVVERRNADGYHGNGLLMVHSRFEYFRELAFVENPQRTGSCTVRIELDDRDEPILTDFLDGPIGRNGTRSIEDNFACFDEVLKMLREQTAERKSQLEVARLTVSEIFNGMNERLKMVPPLLRSSNPEEKVPLVRYVLLGTVAEQFEIEPIVIVQSPDLGGVQLREELHQHIVRVCTLAGIFPLRLDDTVQMSDRDQIVLVLLERLELGYHIVMEEAGRAEMRHRHPVHIDLEVWMFHLIQQPFDTMLHALLHVVHVQPVLAVDCAVLNVALVVFVILSVMDVLSMLHQPEMVNRSVRWMNGRTELQQLLA
uniref:Uncharacterized protein n=1 Tax=Anopheles minimus TaxID=112268 RepID=A0A182WKU8_9DIPT